MIVDQNGEVMPPLGDYRDSQIAILTRERDDAIAERDAAIARAEGKKP